MKIAVLVKQVPDTATQIAVNTDGSGIVEDGVKWVVNPYDEFAIEAAIALSEKHAGEVIVVSVGPARVIDAMRTALAMGAHRAIHISTDDGAQPDSYLTALAIANALREEGVQYIFGGKQAVDDDAGQVMQAVAERLQMPVVSVVESLEADADGLGLTVHRPVSAGIKDVISIKAPAVLACDKGLNQPRYPSLPGIMKAKQKPVATMPIADLVGDANAKVRAVSFAMPPERAAGKQISGEAADCAEQLVQWLRSEAKVI